METLRSRKVASVLENDFSFRFSTNHDVRADRGRLVGCFAELVELVARLSFYNPEYVLLYRGQSGDWLNRKGNSSLKPTIFRVPSGRKRSLPTEELRCRYGMLREAERILCDAFVRNAWTGRQRILRHRLLRWAILQHYEVCGTPLLDVTHSLRVAASFATNVSTGFEPVLYVLAVPALSGSITASSEQGFQIIRLSSICPPDARRPYFQEGYLMGEYPDLAGVDEGQTQRSYEIDFGRRLLAKFRLARENFWSPQFAAIPNEALYPDERDPLVAICMEIKKHVQSSATEIAFC